MRRNILMSLLALATAICLPFLVRYRSGVEAGAQAETGSGSSDFVGSSYPDSSGSSDSALEFTVLMDGGVSRQTMSSYLPHVLAGEMPASFDIEALKAQAVAARTYILHQKTGENPKHPDADVCTDSNCCKAYINNDELKERWGSAYDVNLAKINDAVSITDGICLMYENQPIQAVFHSSSCGKTEDSQNLWTALPYLVSVDSPEQESDVPDFVTTVEVSPQNFRETVLAFYPDALLEPNAPESWLGGLENYDSGRVASVTLGKAAIPGNQLRTMFSLRSTAFTLRYTGESFIFTVSGYGHGVGLSQYGANVMAGDGFLFSEILAHYYPGTELVNLGDS